MTTVKQAGRKGGQKRAENIYATKYALLKEIGGLTSKRYLDFVMDLNLSINELEQIIGMLHYARETKIQQ